MCEFDQFQVSLRLVCSAALQLRDKKPNNLTETDWESLRAVFCNSLHVQRYLDRGEFKSDGHLLPKLLPPVDRQYTLRFLFRHGQITNGIEIEWKKLVEILARFFYAVAQSALF